MKLQRGPIFRQMRPIQYLKNLVFLLDYLRLQIILHETFDGPVLASDTAPLKRIL